LTYFGTCVQNNQYITRLCVPIANDNNCSIHGNNLQSDITATGMKLITVECMHTYLHTNSFLLMSYHIQKLLRIFPTRFEKGSKEKITFFFRFNDSILV